MKKNDIRIYCKNTRKNEMSFYVQECYKGELVYLFSTDFFSKTIFDTYRGGTALKSVFVNTKYKAHQRIKERILRTLRYIEQEYEMMIFNKTIQKKTEQTHYNRAA